MHFKKNIIRVVHSWHFWPIFQPFSISFFFSIFLKFETENERNMNTKWNPNVAFTKMDLKNDYLFGSLPDGKNAFLLHFSNISFSRRSQ